MRSLVATLAVAAMMLSGTGCAEAGDRHDRRIRIINNTNESIWEFRASNIRDKYYRDDLLGSRVISPGKHAIVDLDDGTGYCRFDFMTVMESGERLYKNDVDVCTLVNYRITR